MAVRALPRDVAPGGAVTPASFEAVAGQRLVVPLRAGEPGPLLLVAPAHMAERIAARFASAEPRGSVAPPERPDRSSDWRMIRLDGFGGY